jgi:hypothetical protein
MLSLTSILCVALASYYTTLVLRTLGVLAPLRGKKPLSCSVCMACWSSLPWSLMMWAGWADWKMWTLEAGAAAGITLALLSAYEWTKARVGWKDPVEVKAEDFGERW